MVTTVDALVLEVVEVDHDQVVVGERGILRILLHERNVEGVLREDRQSESFIDRMVARLKVRGRFQIAHERVVGDGPSSAEDVLVGSNERSGGRLAGHGEWTTLDVLVIVLQLCPGNRVVGVSWDGEAGVGERLC